METKQYMYKKPMGQRRKYKENQKIFQTDYSKNTRYENLCNTTEVESCWATVCGPNPVQWQSVWIKFLDTFTLTCLYTYGCFHAIIE